MNWNDSLVIMLQADSGVQQTLVERIVHAAWFPAVSLGFSAVLLIIVCLLSIMVYRKNQQLHRLSDRQPEGEIRHIRIGKVHGQGARSYQQDSFGVSDPELVETSGLLAVVADGMGGLADGDRISTAVVETVLDGFTYSQGQGTPEQVLLTLTQWSVREVNRLLGPERYRSGGSTMAMGMIRGGYFSWVCVGDSRICLYRGGQLIQLNREHDLKQKLALQAVNGEIPLQEVYTDKRRDALVSFMGMGPLDQIDLPSSQLALLPGDQLVIMSDGIYNALDEQEICTALSKGAEQSPEALEQAIQAKAYPDQDNYTAIILSCEPERQTASKCRRERSRKKQ